MKIIVLLISALIAFPSSLFSQTGLKVNVNNILKNENDHKVLLFNRGLQNMLNLLSEVSYNSCYKEDKSAIHIPMSKVPKIMKLYVDKTIDYKILKIGKSKEMPILNCPLKMFHDKNILNIIRQ